MDFGCGPGFLLDKFISKGYACFGFDYSGDTVKNINEKYRDMKNWKGAISSNEFPIMYPDNYFDLILCVETMEHTLEKDL